MLTRRRLIQTGLLATSVMITPYVRSANPAKHGESWDSCCRNWMQLIFTLEERASLILWESVKLRLNRESRYARQVVAGFDYLRAFPIPNNKVELDFFLMQRNWPAAFIRKFRKWLLGVYYSSELGWQELGFVMPPQPAGYRIQLTPVKLI